MRNKRLDVLRCIAVLLVLARHARGRTLVNRAGWVGVDLFFVLSGFLISGLLFAEYKKRGTIDFKRFFIRRGFKIYPMFYLLMLFTVPVQFFGLHEVSPVRNYLAEIFYVQNYLPHIWIQTWSLAVEEHFYILLPLFLLLLIRVSSDRENPFRSIPVAFVVVALACLAFRIRTTASVSSSQLSWNISETHERIDALFFGVLLGYFYHFKPQRLRIFGSKRCAPFLMLAGATLVSTSLFFRQETRFMLTFGLTALYLGFGIILILSLQLNGLMGGIAARAAERVGGALAFVGMYSYSIYVWHAAIIGYLPGFLRRASGIDLWHNDLFYYVSALVFGILMSRLIEYPILRIRDRIFPSGSKPLAANQYPRA